MSLRALLVALIAVATVSFVVGTAIERNSSGESGHHEGATATSPEAGTSSGENHAETSGETPAAHANESAGTTTETSAESSHTELRPLGIDIEAWPFVALAAVASLALALAAWLRPESVPLLALVAVAMLAFAVLDVREIIHQSDINKTGLAVLAGFIATLHIAAALVAATMAAHAHQPHTGPPDAADTMPA
jgi:hypothetical protein